jgi:hypothetical protein
MASHRKTRLFAKCKLVQKSKEHEMDPLLNDNVWVIPPIVNAMVDNVFEARYKVATEDRPFDF